MISVNKNATYYLDKLKLNPINDNKYVYLSGFEGGVEIVNEEWIFDFKVFLNGQYNIPVNSLQVDITTPFAQVQNFGLVKTTSEQIPEYVKDKTTSYCYRLNTIIPTGSSEYFDTKMINHPIDIDLDFNVNVEALDTASELHQVDKDQFISEFDNIKAHSKVLYTNYYEASDQGDYGIVEKYYLINETAQIVDPKRFKWALNNDCLDLTTPILELLDIELDGNFVVKGCQIDFNYALENQEIKTLTHKIENPSYCVKNYHLDFPFATSFDEEKQEVVISQGTEKGFFIPKNAYGYYTLTLLLATTNNWITLKLNKSFNFIVDSSYSTDVKVEQIFIDDITNFTRMVI